ncbi:MAG: MarR family transcriptional regulator [Sphingomonas sp.]
MAPIRPHLRDAGVTEQQWRVLRVLSDEGPLDFKTLADHALLHAPSVTRIIRELVDRGLILRILDETDKRRSILSLTRPGRDLVTVTAQHTINVLDMFAERFGPERLAALCSELNAFADTVGMDLSGSED